MSKTLKYWALALCPALLAISCEKEATLEDETPAQPQKVFRTITLEFPDDPETRVSLAADGKTAWEAGDEILIHGQKMGHSGEEYYSRVVTLAAGDIKDEGKTATFTFEDIVADKSWGRTGYKTTLFAAYPALAICSYNNGDSWYYTTGFKTTNTLLLAGCNDTSVNDGNTFRFINLSGVLSFVVDGDFDSYVFQGKGGETVGYSTFSVRVDTESTFGDKNDIPHSSGSGVLTSGPQTTLSGPVTADGSTVNYLYFPNGVNLSAGFMIQFLKGGDVVQYVSTNSARNIARGKYLKLGDITSHLKTYVAPSSHDATAPAIAGATDLGASGTANCYVVNAGDAANQSKVFKFKAVKGNSAVNVGAIESVEILWETYNDNNAVTANSIIAAVDYDKQPANDYYEICFQMPATLHAGNAVIAAKNSVGNILWSWHIWVPSSEVADITDTGFVNASSGKLMDRNLGAIEPTEAGTTVVPTTAFGLYYQWGRKDPFITSDWSCNARVPFSTSSGWVTTETAVQNPTVFYKQKDDSTSPATYNWNSSEISTLWEDSGKTIYDPCPPAYRVDVYNSSKRMWKYSDTTGWEANTTYGWVKYGSIVFPLSGYTETLSPYKLKERTILWSASYKDIERAYAVYTSPSPSYNSYYKYFGAAVRCVAE